MPKSETVRVQKTGQTWTKEFKAVVFPKVGFSFSRQGSHYNPDAYSHGGIHPQCAVNRADKADPYGFRHEVPPQTGSVVWELDYGWGDQAWMAWPVLA